MENTSLVDYWWKSFSFFFLSVFFFWRVDLRIDLFCFALDNFNNLLELK
jgi:hypothetical protein